MTEAKLCYVHDNWVYFTTQELSKQWGDDWDDAPYEHNAGAPYSYGLHDKEAGREPWTIIKVAWDGEFNQPYSGHCNSPYSVKDINAGVVAWLWTPKWAKEQVVIPAGTTLYEFGNLIRKGGGNVYIPAKIVEDTQ